MAKVSQADQVLRLLVVCAGGIVLLCCAGVLTDPGARTTKRQPTTAHQEPSETEELDDYKGPGDVMRTMEVGSAAVDDAAWYAMVEAQTAEDKHGWKQLLQSGKVFIITEDSKVKVLDIGLTSYKVRCLSHPNKGKTGWVHMELVDEGETPK